MAYSQNKPTARDLTSYRTEVILEGDWKKATRFLSQLGPAIAQGSQLGLESAGKKFKTVVTKNLRNGGASLGWAPLAPSTQIRKAKAGFDPSRILYATGTYLRSIAVITKGLRLRVGVKPRTSHPLSDLTVSEIATIHEYGSDAKGIPARPLWGPSWKQFGGGARVKSIIRWHILASLRAKGL